jgi:hypothetical protein
VATYEAVNRCLKHLILVKPGSRLQDDVDTIVNAYMLELEAVPDNLLWQATLAVGREPTEFMPSAGQLYQAALDLMDNQPDSGQAWALVVKAASGNKADLPPLVQSAIDGIGGLDMLRHDKESNNSIHRARFIEQYEAARRRERRRAILDPSRMLE